MVLLLCEKLRKEGDAADRQQDTIAGMQDYIDELLEEIEKFNSQDKVRMAELEAKNKEYKEALVRMRVFAAEEGAEEDCTEQQAGLGDLR